ncbi:MAG: hypothetical protein ACC669_03905 [bacterium]
MKLLDLENQNRRARGRIRLLTAAAGAIILLAGLSGTAAAKKAPSVETVNASATTFNFEVNRNGGITGDINNITFQVSRVEEVTGVLKRCRKIKFIDAYYMLGYPGLSHNPFSEPSSEFYMVGRRELDPPLCNYTNVAISGQPFRNEDISAVCFEPASSIPGRPDLLLPPEFIPGKSVVLNRDIVISHLISTGSVFTGEPLAIPDKIIPLTANIQCAGSAASGGTPPSRGQDDILPSGGATGTTPNWTAGADFSGRNYTPRDPRTGPRASAGSGSTQPAVTPRDPRTRPSVPAGRGPAQPVITPRNPRTRPGTVTRRGAEPPLCRMDGEWKQTANTYWNFAEHPMQKDMYVVTRVPVSRGGSKVPQYDLPALKDSLSIASLSGNKLRWFRSKALPLAAPWASFFEGTVDGTCNQVTGRSYDTKWRNDPLTLIRVKGDRFRVPTPNP